MAVLREAAAEAALAQILTRVAQDPTQARLAFEAIRTMAGEKVLAAVSQASREQAEEIRGVKASVASLEKRVVERFENNEKLAEQRHQDLKDLLLQSIAASNQRHQDAEKLAEQRHQDAERRHQDMEKRAEQRHQDAERRHQDMEKRAEQRHQDAEQRHQDMEKRAEQRHQDTEKLAEQRHQDAEKRHQDAEKLAEQRHQDAEKRHQDAEKLAEQRHQDMEKRTEQRHQHAERRHQDAEKLAEQRHQHAERRHQDAERRAEQRHQDMQRQHDKLDKWLRVLTTAVISMVLALLASLIVDRLAPGTGSMAAESVARPAAPAEPGAVDPRNGAPEGPGGAAPGTDTRP